jgi:hypothetical protein
MGESFLLYVRRTYLDAAVRVAIKNHSPSLIRWIHKSTQSLLNSNNKSSECESGGVVN